MVFSRKHYYSKGNILDIVCVEMKPCMSIGTRGVRVWSESRGSVEFNVPTFKMDQQ